MKEWSVTPCPSDRKEQAKLAEWSRVSISRAKWRRKQQILTPPFSRERTTSLPSTVNWCPGSCRENDQNGKERHLRNGELAPSLADRSYFSEGDRNKGPCWRDFPWWLSTLSPFTVPFPAGPEEAATGLFTIPTWGLERWAGSRDWEATNSCQSWRAWAVSVRSFKSLQKSPRSRTRLSEAQRVLGALSESFLSSGDT